jgi:3-oxoadipate enol-lactonase
VPTAPASIERLGRDLLGLLDHLGIARAHICGLSMGGLTAQWLALHHPGRVERAVFANTAARIGTAEGWEARIAAVRAGGMAAIRDAVVERFFSPAFRAERPEVVGRYAAALEATDPVGYTACCAALRDADLRPAVGAIRAPTLIIAGGLDEATTPAQAEELRAAIPGARLLVLDGAAHLSNVERPGRFSAALAGFFAE